MLMCACGKSSCNSCNPGARDRRVVESGHQWKPGDVAMLVGRGGGEEVGYYDGVAWLYAWGSSVDADNIPGSLVHKIRPLVVIDPEDAAQVQRLVSAFWNAQMPDDGGSSDAHYMTQALREFANPTPPKPEEPTGLGAVVVDSNDVTWVLAGRDLPTATPANWRAFDGPIVGDWKPYSRIDAVRVLSQGVTP